MFFIGGKFGRAFNDSERVLSNGIASAGTLLGKTAQVGELVLSLYDSNSPETHGFFINGIKNVIIGTGLYIPDNHIIAFKGFGTVNAEFAELKGTVTNSSFQLEASILSSNTITGGVSTGNNTWCLNLITPQPYVTGTLYLQMVYAPYLDPCEDPYGCPYGGYAFNANSSLDTLFS